MSNQTKSTLTPLERELMQIVHRLELEACDRDGKLLKQMEQVMQFCTILAENYDELTEEFKRMARS